VSDPCPGSCCIEADHEHQGPWVAQFASPGRAAVVYNFDPIGWDPPGAFIAHGGEDADRGDVRAMLASMAGDEDVAVTVSGEVPAAEVLEAVGRLAARGGTAYVAPGTVITG